MRWVAGGASGARGAGRREAVAAAVVAAIGLACAAGFPRDLAPEPPVPHGMGLAERKGGADDAQGERPERTGAMLATLVQTHTDERVPLDDVTPPPARFDALLADRVTGTAHALDPRLVGLLRTLAARLTPDSGAGAPRIELVSGFRSPKLNEMLRKKGHHVASHSQHSLGNAVDFRVVIACAPGAPDCAPDAGAMALDPRTLEAEIRKAGWDGGVGTYTGKDDWFVHADVGPHRAWGEGPRDATVARAWPPTD